MNYEQTVMKMKSTKFSVYSVSRMSYSRGVMTICDLMFEDGTIGAIRQDGVWSSRYRERDHDFVCQSVTKKLRKLVDSDQLIWH